MLKQLLSIGVIGGADGPTAIFVTTSGPIWPLLLLGAAAVAAVIGLILWRKKRKKSK
ncbi:MAG: LPXTG cell wall anchor domain-containing protein [Oscillospiraceae bacterium]|nr:LPXTG cell wall anchor domain-containing protein [Oscillospiraceae bacterium]